MYRSTCHSPRSRYGCLGGCLQGALRVVLLMLVGKCTFLPALLFRVLRFISTLGYLANLCITHDP